MIIMKEKLKEALSLLKHVLLGKEEEIKLALTCLLAGGHLLLEDLPGTGKTTLALALARVLGCSFARIQFTSDLLQLISWEGWYTILKKNSFSFGLVLFSITLSWPMRLIGPHPRARVPFLKPWKKGR